MIGDMLREWRGARGVSQMGLALDAGVSPRHVSFVESGRARPSRPMVLRLAETLGLPLRDRNAMLVAAGYAPCFGERALDSDDLAELRSAMDIILRAHEPYPAIALDAAFGIVRANEGFSFLAGALGRSGELNLIEEVLSPGPMRNAIENWADVASHLMHRVRERVRLQGPASPLRAIMERAMQQPGVAEVFAASAPNGRVLLPVVLSIGGSRSSWITTVTSFGAPQDAFAEELLIEQFFPASS